MPNTHAFKAITFGENNEVLAEMEFDGPEDLDLFVSTEGPSLPERSPLHPEALNLDDLEAGMIIQQHNINGYGFNEQRAIVGAPFLRGEKYQEPWDTQGDDLMLPVVTIDYHGNLRHEDWFLADMGIVPYVGDNGPFWNDQNYTLAVR